MNLIFDRTELDLKMQTMKAYYNSNDFNRIEDACNEVSRLLNKYGYENSIIVKSNWTISDIPNKADVDRILDNLQLLREVYYIFPDSPKTPENMDMMDIYRANDIEKILYDIDMIIQNMIKQFRYCGTINCGE